MPTAVSLRTVIGHYGYTEALFDGRVESDRVTLEIQPVEGVLRNAMTRMVRESAFDLCELSPTSYLMARLSGAPLVALPVFPYRQFPFDQIVVRSGSGIAAPGDLAGARIGLRTWAQPTGLWIREILGSFYGCDLTSVRWTFVAEDPVAHVSRPAGSRSCVGQTLENLLAEGQIDAALGLREAPPGSRGLLGEPLEQARSWYGKTGLIPANHLLVMRREAYDPGLGSELCRMFDAAKELYLTTEPAADPLIGPLRSVTGLADPLPSGWAPNALMWETLVAAAARQAMIGGTPAAGDLLERCEAIDG